MILSVFFGVTLPIMAILFFTTITDRQELLGVRFERDGLISAFIVSISGLLIIFAYYKAISVLCVSFGIYTPIGVVLFSVLSAPATVHTLMVMAELGTPESGLHNFSESIVGSFFIAFLFFNAACLLRIWSGSRRYSNAILALSYLWLVTNALRFDLSRHDGVNAMFSMGINNLTWFSYAMLFCSPIVICVCMVYANSVCDWLSVAITRHLTLLTCVSASAPRYAVLMLVDCVVAVIMYLVTIAVFAFLAYLYFNFADLPADLYMRGVMTAISSDSIWMRADVPDASVVAGMLGIFSGNFLRFFALTAVLPTLFHMAMIAVFGSMKMFGVFFSGPAEAIIERKREADSGGDASILLLHRTIYGGFVFAMTLFSMLTGYLLTLVVS